MVVGSSVTVSVDGSAVSGKVVGDLLVASVVDTTTSVVGNSVRACV